MAEKSLPDKIDDFELELTCISALIDILYMTSGNHPYHSKYLEELHSHKANMHESYNKIRKDILCGVIG